MLDDLKFNGAEPVGARWQMSALAAIETHALGERLLLRSRASGACVLSNPDGGAILEGVRRQLSRSDLAGVVAELSGLDVAAAADAVALTLDSWDAAGLFASAAPTPEPIRQPVNGEESVNVRAFELLGRGCQIRSEHVFLLDQISAILASYQRPNCLDIPAGFAGLGQHIAIDISGTWDDFALFRDGRCLKTGLDHDQIRHLAMREAMAALAGHDAVSALLHAACVVQGDRSLLLPGVSGTGKTTLALDLATAGWQHAGDDLIPLMREGARVAVVPTAASVKRRDVWDPHSLTDTAEIDLEAALGLEYRWPPNPATAGSCAAVSAIMFPAFAPDQAPKIERLAPVDGFVGLLQTGADLLEISDSIGPLAALADRVPAFRITYPNSEIAVRQCTDVLHLASVGPV